MALALAYVNEVLNHLPATVVVSEKEWPELIKALKFEGRDLESCIIGMMRLRWTMGGWDGLMARLDAVTKERDSLVSQVADLTKQLDQATSPQNAAIV